MTDIYKFGASDGQHDLQNIIENVGGFASIRNNTTYALAHNSSKDVPLAGEDTTNDWVNGFDVSTPTLIKPYKSGKYSFSVIVDFDTASDGLVYGLIQAGSAQHEFLNVAYLFPEIAGVFPSICFSSECNLDANDNTDGFFVTIQANNNSKDTNIEAVKVIIRYVGE